MHLSRLLVFRRVIVMLLVVTSAAILASCAPVIGYPHDPENTDAALATLTSQYFGGGTREQAYFNTPLSNTAMRMQLRNEIILGRMRAYDIEFADFERKLYGDGNGVSLGSDLVGLVLAGLTATTGNAATKSALGAASAGVIGAKAAIDKDLYYQKTIPALLAQMEADRLNALASITKGMTASDAAYPLMQAYADLDAYRNAGSIPAAINAVNKEAGNAKDAAQAAIALPPASAVDQLKGIQTVQAQLKTLTTDAQYVALAQVMQINLLTRSSGLQQTINAIDPKALRLSGNGKKARQVINIWIEQDDVSPANQQQWLTAIAAVSKNK